MIDRYNAESARLSQSDARNGEPAAPVIPSRTSDLQSVLSDGFRSVNLSHSTNSDNKDPTPVEKDNIMRRSMGSFLVNIAVRLN